MKKFLISFDLSVVILSFNTKGVTDECLTKLKKAVNYSKKTLKNNLEVTVIDNNSTDGSAEMIKSKHPWVKLTALKENTGFSKGNNIGMKEAKYPFILLLNSDCFVNETTLVDALNYFDKKTDCDVLGAKLILTNGKTQVSNGYLYNPINTFFWISGLPWIAPIHPRGITNEEKQVGWVMGAFFMLKREVYEKTRGFDENIFMYGEEVEWCKRIHDAGFRVFYVPSIVADHMDKASSKGNSEKPFVSEIKGIIYFMKKHYGVWYPIVSFVIKIFLIVRISVFYLKGNEQRVRAYREALKT